MGSFAFLKVGAYEALEMKTSVDPTLMTVFRESDRVFTKSSANTELADVAAYRSTAAILAKRLDIMGFTPKAAEAAFNSALKPILDHYPDDEDHKADVEESFLRNYNYHDWRSAISKIVVNTTPRTINDDWHRQYESVDNFICSYSNDEFIQGFPITKNWDVRYMLKGLLSCVAPSTAVELDFSDLVNGGYYDENVSLTIDARDQFSDRFVAGSKIIILTEGSQDCFVLSKAMQLLYPHIYEYYSFMDFAGSSVAGGASHLAQAVKNFKACGIVNKTIAIFDNDTAGRSHAKALKDILLPKNIKVLYLPIIDIAKNYPTIGPQGVHAMDVNGLAGGIELYFGSDVLGKNGREFPVVWQGFMPDMQEYQGEVKDKKKAQGLFCEKLALCAQDIMKVGEFDFADMHEIMNEIFGAFESFLDA